MRTAGKEDPKAAGWHPTWPTVEDAIHAITVPLSDGESPVIAVHPECGWQADRTVPARRAIDAEAKLKAIGAELAKIDSAVACVPACMQIAQIVKDNDRRAVSINDLVGIAPTKTTGLTIH